MVSADKSKLTRVIVNILSNAIKYTPDGGKITVRLREKREAGRVLIEVRDSGIGIPEKEISCIFERFYRASNSSDNGNVQSSSGIGLHIMKEYLAMHGGEISVDSVVGQGSVFTVSIPVIQSEEKPVTTAGDAADDGKPVILLAEDNDQFRKIMIDKLSQHYRVIGVADGKQALDPAKRGERGGGNVRRAGRDFKLE